VFLLAETHQNGIAGDLVEPGGESGLTAKLADSAKHSQKGLLSQILSLHWIFDHAKTESIDSVIMQAVKEIKCSGVALLSQAQRLTFGKAMCFRLHWMLVVSFLHTPTVMNPEHSVMF